MSTSMKAIAIVLCLTGATLGAQTTTTQPSSQPAHTWKWDGKTFATEEQVTELKEKLVGMSMDDLCASLKSNNFSPPRLSSKSAGTSIYKTVCRLKNAKGHLFAYHFEISVNAAGVTEFKYSMEDEDNPGVLVPQ